MSNNKNSNPNQGEKENKKVILLDLSRTERAFEEEESLWDIEIEKIEDRLADHRASLEEYGDEKDPSKKPLLAIAILGYPGSGKTSMLHTLVERVKKRKLENVSSLPVIKPNLVVEGDHFLYAFLAEALRMDREEHKHENDQDRETPFISRVQHKFQEVSEYLQVLNKTGHKHEGDPLGVSLERLERHESGLMLIEKMTGFIDELANSLGGNTKQSIVLLPVDDADMSREVLNSALDTCWRFIKHPRLVPIFTFTGRLAEELLRVNYDKKLNSGSSSEKLKEASTSTLVTENMAIQHLGKLFPVRNRIKMGPAAARVQVAEYRPFKGGPVNKVSDLLEKASTLLFGHTQLLVGHSIRPPFRMVTLRRQIQIIDAIQGTGIEQFMEKTETKKLKPWSVIFDLAAWSLLNAHRDVLKEIHLNLDDLYSWTPKGLRQVILNSILMQTKDNMDKLHKHWRYRTDDRRSQIISLLAVNTFRPRMDEEPTEDDTPKIIDEWWDNYKDKNKNKDNEKLEEAAKSFPVIKGALWFLNLCIGFYLPQVFSWRGLPGNKEKDMETSRVTGIGWGLLSGPLHAVREALKKKKVFSSGILFLDPLEFNTPLKDKNYRFFIHVWCYYGFQDEWPWAAISLWRGLGLMGKVIEVFENYRKSSDEYGEKNLKEHIEKIITRHFESARVFSNLPKGKEIKEDYRKLNTDIWEYNDDAGEEMENLIPKFAKAMLLWLEKNWSVPIEDENGKETGKEENRIFPMEEEKEEETWGKCFIRRLHGDNLMSIFWKDLENAYFKKNLKDWNAGLIIYQWKKLLSKYWDKCDQIKNLLESCPIWPDYRIQGLYKKGELEFDWKDVKVSPLEEYNEKTRVNTKKLEEENKILEEEKKKPVEEINKKDKEKNIKNLEEKIKKLKKKNEGIYDKIAEKKYGDNIKISRADLDNYFLFSDEDEPPEHKIKGSLTIPDESKKNGDVSGKKIPFDAVVSKEKKEKEKKEKEEKKEGQNGTGVKL